SPQNSPSHKNSHCEIVPPEIVSRQYSPSPKYSCPEIIPPPNRPRAAVGRGRGVCCPPAAWRGQDGKLHSAAAAGSRSAGERGTKAAGLGAKSRMQFGWFCRQVRGGGVWEGPGGCGGKEG
ncbi:unnamed protein product, partial [Bubo scandiacus]